MWFDALINYISALGYATEGEPYRRYWEINPSRVHVIGKGILRFHAAYWPAMLLSAQLPPPSTLLVHGYLTAEGRKISKSLGTVVDPASLARAFGTDVLRYYLLSQFRPGADGDFSIANLVKVRDNDLADQLGNLVSRVIAMVHRYRGGQVSRAGVETFGGDKALIQIAVDLLKDVDGAMDALEVDQAMSRVWDLVREANRYIVREAPWELAKQTNSAVEDRLSAILSVLVEVLRLLAAFSNPFIPAMAQKIALLLNLPDGWDRLRDEPRASEEIGASVRVGESMSLFPKS